MAFLPVAQHILSNQTRSVHNSRKKTAVHFGTLGAMSGNFHYSHLMCRNSIYSHCVNAILLIILQKLTKWLPVSLIPYLSCDTCYKRKLPDTFSSLAEWGVAIHDTSNNISYYQSYRIHRITCLCKFPWQSLKYPKMLF